MDADDDAYSIDGYVLRVIPESVETIHIGFDEHGELAGYLLRAPGYRASGPISGAGLTFSHVEAPRQADES